MSATIFLFDFFGYLKYLLTVYVIDNGIRVKDMVPPRLPADLKDVKTGFTNATHIVVCVQ